MSVEKRWEQAGEDLQSRLKHTPHGTKEALKRLQPFYGVPRVNPLQHPLFALQTLSNLDKHRRLNLLVHRADLAFVDAEGKRIFDGPNVQTRVSPTDDAYTLFLSVGEMEHADVYLKPRYDVHLNEHPLNAGVIETVEAISEYIEEYVVPVVVGLLPS